MKATTLKTVNRYYPIFAILLAAFSALEMKDWNIVNAINPFFVLILFFISGGYLCLFLIKRSLSYSTRELRKRLIPFFLIFYVGFYLTANLSITLVNFVAYLIKGYDLSTFLPSLFHYELPAGNGKLHIYLMVFTIIFLYILWAMTAKKETKLKEEKLNHQYQTLKAKVNPHFLFNSLNTLSEMVYEDAKKADEYIQELSKVYRYVLDNEETQLVDLPRELEFVQRYFNLQNIRTNGKVSLSIELNHPEDYKIIPVALQILIENAIKHNRATAENPLNISVLLKHDTLIVTNNLQRKITMETSTRKGLESLNELLKLLIEKELEIVETAETYKVILPLIKK